MRCKGIINHIISKIQRVQDRKENVFFHSNDIFTKITNN